MGFYMQLFNVFIFTFTINCLLTPSVCNYDLHVFSAAHVAQRCTTLHTQAAARAFTLSKLPNGHRQQGFNELKWT